MSKRQLIMLLGVVVIFLPFLGFTSVWKTIIEVVCGLLVVAIAYEMAPAVKVRSGTVQTRSTVDGRVVAEDEDTALASELPFVDHHSKIEKEVPQTFTTAK